MKILNSFAKALALSTVASLTALTSVANSAEWPTEKPVRIVVPQAAGGTNDTVARLIADELSRAFKQSFVVENRPGASGAIGMQNVAQSRPDGYTLAIASDTATILGAVRSDLAWNFKRDLTGIGMIADQPIGLAVSGKSPYKSLTELMADAKSKPGTIAFGTSGLWTSQQITGEWLAREAGVELIHVPYKGGGQAVTDLVGNQIPFAVLGLAPLIDQHRGNYVRLLAVTSPKRDPQLPEVPTLSELGYSDIVLTQWVGVVAPKATPPEVVEKLSAELTKIVRKPEVSRKLQDSGLTVRPMPAVEFESFLDQTIDQWQQLVVKLSLKLN